MQAAFKDCHDCSAGFCTPGMVLSAIDLVARHPTQTRQRFAPSSTAICAGATGYHNIVKAVKQGAAAMGK